MRHIRRLSGLFLLAALTLLSSVTTSAAQDTADPTAELIISFNLPSGVTVLYVQGEALRWHHLSGAFPDDITINGVRWKPSWDDCLGKAPDEPCYSSYFHGAIALYNPDSGSGTGLTILPDKVCAVGGYSSGLFDQCAPEGWTSNQYVQQFFYERSSPDGTSAYHLWFSSTGLVSVRVTYDYVPREAFFDVVPNDTENYLSCNPTSGLCKVLVGIWNAFTLVPHANEHPDASLLWPAADPSTPWGGPETVTLSLSSDRFGTVAGLMSKSYFMDYDRDGNWDWVVPIHLPATFGCTPGEVIEVTVDLMFPTTRHLRGMDVVRCGGS